MKVLFNNFVFFTLISISSYGYSQVQINSIPKPIVFNSNTNTPLTSTELEMLQEVYGMALKKEILDRPSRLLVMKEILRNRVIIKEIKDPKNHKPCPRLSEVPIFDAFVSNLKRDISFQPSSFNPLKYNFEFHNPSIQRFKVEGSNFFIIIKPQHYNK